jgi:AAA domain-containing protein/IclR-like helix-turn-helix domain-containing protein
MALDMCLAVAGARFCLGERKPAEGDVLCCALEDNSRRLRRRIDRLLPPKSHAWPERLILATEWRRLDKGGVDDLQEWAESVPKPKLIVLDTLAGVRPIRAQNGYMEDYESVVTLHRLANKIGIAILVLHHTRKMEADDPIDTVSGTLGLPGCADTILVLDRKSQGTTLYVRGRDIEEAEHAITFDKIGCRWTILGDATEVHRSKERGKILAVLDEATEEMGPKEIAIAAGMSDNNVRRLLYSMVTAGEVVKAERGEYRHPGKSFPSQRRYRPSGNTGHPR